MRPVAPRALALALALTLATTRAHAQRWGAHVGFNFEYDDLLAGAQASLPIVPRASLYPSFDYYFVDVGSVWSLNLDLKYRPPTRYGAFYFGGGVTYTSAGSGSSDTGLGLIAGLEGRRRTAAYVETRLLLGGAGYFQIVGGLSWRR